jgi:hypothetical protein
VTMPEIAIGSPRLMMNSNFVGCLTGMSAGLVPLRILSTCLAVSRNNLIRSALDDEGELNAREYDRIEIHVPPSCFEWRPPGTPPHIRRVMAGVIRHLLRFRKGRAHRSLQAPFGSAPQVAINRIDSVAGNVMYHTADVRRFMNAGPRLLSQCAPHV